MFIDRIFFSQLIIRTPYNDQKKRTKGLNWFSIPNGTESKAKKTVRLCKTLKDPVSHSKIVSRLQKPMFFISILVIFIEKVSLRLMVFVSL